MPAQSFPTVSGKRPPLEWAREYGLAEPVLLEIEHQVRLKNNRRKKAAASIGSVLLVAALLSWAVPYFRETGIMSTPAGHRETIALQDGSELELNACSQVHTDFRYGRRTVRLEGGEVFFSVAHDPAHPFLVQTAAGTVRVTGTRFNVLVGKDGRLTVTLLEGGVTMTDVGPEGVRLKPGQQLAVAGHELAVHSLGRSELDDVVAWRRGLLALDGLSIVEAVARMASFHGVEIEIAPGVGGMHLGGSVPLDDLKGFFSALEESASVRVVRQGDSNYRIVPR